MANSVLSKSFAAKDIKAMPPAGGCKLEECKGCCKDVEEVRLHLCGTGDFTAFKSATFHICILKGSQLLRFLMNALHQAVVGWLISNGFMWFHYGSLFSPLFDAPVFLFSELPW